MSSMGGDDCRSRYQNKRPMRGGHFCVGSNELVELMLRDYTASNTSFCGVYVM